jgi:hypothetical protein
MKYKVDWNSPSQGLQSTTVEAIGISQAREQVESMYAHIEGFRTISVSPVFEKKEYEKPQQSYNSDSTYSSGGGSDDDFSTIVATMALFVGGVIALFGLFTLPVGILAMVVGGAIGWVGWKLAGWLSDRGW